MLARTNRADEHRPWAIIIIRPPERPHFVLVDMPANIMPICPTEEYAIKDFKSGWRRHKNLVITAPQSLILIRIGEIFSNAVL